MEEEGKSGGDQTQTNSNHRFFETVVIGGGQVGLFVGYELAKRQRPFVIFDANNRIGDAWRNRWDSLKLFTPAYLNDLKGMRIKGNPYRLISKDEMADYLEAYAERFKLPVQTGMKVDGLAKRGNNYMISVGDKHFEAKNVVVAMSNFQQPYIPDFAKDINRDIIQLHTMYYKNPSQLQKGRVLVVGAGNSGAEISIDVAKEHQTFISGNLIGHVPFRIEPFLARFFLVRLVRFAGHNILNTGTPIGRKVRQKLLFSGDPLVRTKPNDLTKAGIERLPKVKGVKNGFPVLADDRVIEVENIIWCTGFRPGFSWINLPVLGEREEPYHKRGIVTNEQGLHFVGLHYLYAATSSTITGMQRDANYIVKNIVSS